MEPALVQAYLELGLLFSNFDWMMQSMDMQGPPMPNSTLENPFGRTEETRAPWHPETPQQGMTFMPMTMAGNCNAVVSKYWAIEY